MEVSDAVERISGRMEAKGIAVDRSKIESKIRRLVEEFGVQLAEAERTVWNEMAREHSLPSPGARAQEREIQGLTAGEWVTVQGKVVALTSPPTPAIAQAGILADPTGAIRFTVWARAKAQSLSAGTWYRIESAVVDEFRGVEKLNIHSGTVITEVENEAPLIPKIIPIRELRPGVGSVRVKVVQEWEPSHERMLQTGLLGDETGTIKFTIWRDDGKEKLTPGKVYSVYYALVDEFNGRLQLNLTSAMYLPEEGDIRVSEGEASRGVIVHLAPGSGLIKRCPVEGCNRVLSRQNYCPVHEIQKTFRYDLRIKGVLDDGIRTRNILVQKDLVEALSGMKLEEAVALAESSPLGMDEVFYRIRDAVLGRYFQVRGSEMDGRILVKECQRITFDPADLAALLNRAGGEAK
ncbi:MAG: nucleotide-binding protein [Methanomicrobiales archaeon]|nr:nucleotide-binding protein [Methanomicrobiales archaeon]